MNRTWIESESAKENGRKIMVRNIFTPIESRASFMAQPMNMERNMTNNAKTKKNNIFTPNF